jgi:hypothetical protein
MIVKEDSQVLEFCFFFLKAAGMYNLLSDVIGVQKG